MFILSFSNVNVLAIWIKYYHCLDWRFLSDWDRVEVHQRVTEHMHAQLHHDHVYNFNGLRRSNPKTPSAVAEWTNCQQRNHRRNPNSPKAEENEKCET